MLPHLNFSCFVVQEMMQVYQFVALLLTPSAPVWSDSDHRDLVQIHGTFSTRGGWTFCWISLSLPEQLTNCGCSLVTYLVY